jgi:hypothetical protein
VNEKLELDEESVPLTYHCHDVPPDVTEPVGAICMAVPTAVVRAVDEKLKV